VNKPIKWEHWSSVGICDWPAEHLSLVIQDRSMFIVSEMIWGIQVFCVVKAAYQLNVYHGNPRCGYHFHSQFAINKTMIKESKQTKTNHFVFCDQWFLCKEEITFSFIDFWFYWALNKDHQIMRGFKIVIFGIIVVLLGVRIKLWTFLFLLQFIRISILTHFVIV